MTICASRMHLGLVNSTAMNPSPVGEIGDKGQQSGTQVQFKRSPAPSSGGYPGERTYNLNTGGVVEIPPPGTTSVSV